MANTSAAKKAIRQSGKRRTQNRKQRDSFRGAIKNIKKLVIAGEIDKAITEMPMVVSIIDKAVKKNLLHKNNAARKKSQLAKMVVGEPLKKSLTITK